MYDPHLLHVYCITLFYACMTIIYPTSMNNLEVQIELCPGFIETHNLLSNTCSDENKINIEQDEEENDIKIFESIFISANTHVGTLAYMGNWFFDWWIPKQIGSQLYIVRSLMSLTFDIQTICDASEFFMFLYLFHLNSVCAWKDSMKKIKNMCHKWPQKKLISCWINVFSNFLWNLTIWRSFSTVMLPLIQQSSQN